MSQNPRIFFSSPFSCQKPKKTENVQNGPTLKVNITSERRIRTYKPMKVYLSIDITSSKWIAVDPKIQRIKDKYLFLWDERIIVHGPTNRWTPHGQGGENTHTRKACAEKAQKKQKTSGTKDIGYFVKACSVLYPLRHLKKPRVLWHVKTNNIDTKLVCFAKIECGIKSQKHFFR